MVLPADGWVGALAGRVCDPNDDGPTPVVVLDTLFAPILDRDAVGLGFTKRSATPSP